MVDVYLQESKELGIDGSHVFEKPSWSPGFLLLEKSTKKSGPFVELYGKKEVYTPEN